MFEYALDEKNLINEDANSLLHLESLHLAK